VKEWFDMRLSDPTVPEEMGGISWRSLRLLVVPAILAIALYAFYAIGSYNTQVAAPKTPKHGNIYGTVVDEKQRPVGGASITIAFASSKEPMPYVTPSTDSNGHFYLQDLPAGTYILQATGEGFDMQTQSTGVAPGKTTQIKLPIYRTAIRMRPH
jgi:hypothetical protein